MFALMMALWTSAAVPNPACAVFTLNEVKSVTGFAGYNWTHEFGPEDSAYGGWACYYSVNGLPVDAKGRPIPNPPRGPEFRLGIVDGKNLTHTKRIAPKCQKEPVSGVGEEAFFEVCPNEGTRWTSFLYVKAGAKDLLMQIEIESPDTDATMRPRLLALAKAAVAKLR